MTTDWDIESESERMKEIFRHISSVIAVVMCALCAAGCVYDRAGECGPDNYLLVIHISPVDAVSGEVPPAQITEKIRTLRVVVLNETALECNKLITVDDPETVVAARFMYDFSLPTTAGEKEIYLIANEAGVSGLQYQPADASDVLPDGLPDNLTELLESYDTASDASEFRRVMSAVYFAPDFTPEDDGALYLPYTSLYSGIETVQSAVTTVSMHLVPVATKLTFEFVNKRENVVQVNDITVTQADSEHFLFARVGDDDFEKSFDGRDYYWIDWLAKVSAALHELGGYYENVDSNTKYGWISDYEKPQTSELSPAVLVNAASGVSVPAADVATETPGMLTVGPFYLPESINEYTYQGTYKDDNGQWVTGEITEQIYYLTLGLHDVTSDEADDPKFNDVVISNLKSLFRNTSVIIKVTMSQGEVAVYAEIADWTVRRADGWVVEGPEGGEIK